MTTVRIVLFLLGLALMAIALFVPFVPRAEPEGRGWFSWSWLFSLGLLIALAAHGWPDRLT